MVSNFLKRLFGKRASGHDDAPTSDIPGDLHEAALALMQANTGADNCFLAYLSPDRVHVAESRYYLRTESMLPQHVLACWTWQDAQWQPVDAADYLARRERQGTERIEFAVCMAGEQAIIVRKRIFQVLETRCGGSGGTVILQRTPQGWVKSDEPGEAWII